MRKSKFSCFLLLLSIICACFNISSCTITQGFDFDTRLSNTGTSSTFIQVDDFFTTLAEDFSQWDSSSEESNTAVLSLDDSIEEFTNILKSNPQISLVDFNKADDGSWNGSFKFADFNNLIEFLSSNKEQNIISLTKTGLSSRFELRLNLNNFADIKELAPFLKNPNIAAFGPEYNNGLKEADYLEMIAFILGEDGPESIKSSSITITVSTNADIKTTNGVKLSDSQVSFTIPLIDILLLNKEIYFYCEF